MGRRPCLVNFEWEHLQIVKVINELHRIHHPRFPRVSSWLEFNATDVKLHLDLIELQRQSKPMYNPRQASTSLRGASEATCTVGHRSTV